MIMFQNLLLTGIVFFLHWRQESPLVRYFKAIITFSHFFKFSRLISGLLSCFLQLTLLSKLLGGSVLLVYSLVIYIHISRIVFGSSVKRRSRAMFSFFEAKRLSPFSLSKKSIQIKVFNMKNAPLSFGDSKWTRFNLCTSSKHQVWSGYFST